MYQRYEAELMDDIRQARHLTNYVQVLLDYHNKELGWVRPARVRARNAYPLLPSGWNEKVGYPHGFTFTPESPLLTLVGHRLLWDPERACGFRW